MTLTDYHAKYLAYREHGMEIPTFRGPEEVQAFVHVRLAEGSD